MSDARDCPVVTATILDSSMSARSGDIAVKQSRPVSSSPSPWVSISMAPENWAVLQRIMGAMGCTVGKSGLAWIVTITFDQTELRFLEFPAFHSLFIVQRFHWKELTVLSFHSVSSLYHFLLKRAHWGLEVLYKCQDVCVFRRND